MTTVFNGAGIVSSSDYDYEDPTYGIDIDMNEFLGIGMGMGGMSCITDTAYRLPSIQNDIAKLDADASSLGLIDDSNMDIKPEIRNADCMWSAFGNSSAFNINFNNCTSNNININKNTNDNTNSNSAASSYSESSAMPPAIVTGSTLMIKREPIDEEEQQDNNNNNNNSSRSNHKSNSCRSTVKGATTGGGTVTATVSIPARALTRSDSKPIVEPYIPPGGSLLRKSNTQQRQQQQQKQQQQQQQQQQRYTYNSVTGMSSYEMTEFRHNVDLAACVMGSNNISLTSSADANYIDHLSRELQNTSKERIDLPYRVESSQISDVLEVVFSDQQKQQSMVAAAAAAAAAAMEKLTASVDVSAAVASLSPPATTATSSDCDSDDGDCSLGDSATSLDGNGNGGGLFMLHSDHSYTRCNEMETNLETPSDSDEEIDVVSLNDKKLPTNPSDRDRRALQTKVANKISNGARIPQYDLPYTPASNSPVKSVVNSRYPSPSSTPYQSAGAVSASYSPESLSQRSSSSSSSSSSSDSTSPPTTMLADGKSRKRYYMNDCTSTTSSSGRVFSIKGVASRSCSLAAAKKSRVKKVNSPGGAYPLSGPLDESYLKPRIPASSSSTIASSTSSSSSNCGNTSSSSSSNSSMLNRQQSMDEADTIEKRNLHNDMERQRRIGLKNLFEALKKQIPNIRDKERAPKVNILREAAKLCEHLTSEEHNLSLKRQQLKTKLKQQQELLARLRLAKNVAAGIE